jgi:hypothetical protein
MAKKTKHKGGKSGVKVRDLKAHKDAKGGSRLKTSSTQKITTQ